MFWNRKKDRDGPPKPPPPDGPKPPTPGGAGGDGGDQGPGGAHFITGDSDLDRKSVEVLLRAIARISEARDLEAKLNYIVDVSTEITGAERGLLILVGDDGQSAVRVARSREGQNLTDNLRFSTSVVKKVLAEEQPVKATVQTDSDALDLGRSVYDLKLRAVMCVPLKTAPKAEDEIPLRGVLYIDSRAATRDFTRRDLSMFAALSQHISIALENERLHLHSLEKTRLEQSLELARAIQNGLMPPVPKDLRGLEVHGWYRPAERTSGDFFDFVKLPNDRLAVVIGDVSGHGAGPALITAAAQSGLRTSLRLGAEPSAALTLLNQDLCERVESGMFLTLLALVLTEDGRCEVLNAGHHGPLIWRRATRTVEAVDAHGPALGWMSDVSYPVDAVVELSRGDVLVAYTDGLIEAHAPNDREHLFGVERVRVLLGELAEKQKSAKEIVTALAEAALSFSAQKHEDDITLVVVNKT